MTGEQLARAAEYLAHLRNQQHRLVREGFSIKPLIDMEAGACGLLAALGVDVAELKRRRG